MKNFRVISVTLFSILFVFPAIVSAAFAGAENHNVSSENAHRELFMVERVSPDGVSCPVKLTPENININTMRTGFSNYVNENRLTMMGANTAGKLSRGTSTDTWPLDVKIVMFDGWLS